MRCCSFKTTQKHLLSWQKPRESDVVYHTGCGYQARSDSIGTKGKGQDTDPAEGVDLQISAWICI